MSSKSVDPIYWGWVQALVEHKKSDKPIDENTVASIAKCASLAKEPPSDIAVLASVLESLKRVHGDIGDRYNNSNEVPSDLTAEVMCCRAIALQIYPLITDVMWDSPDGILEQVRSELPPDHESLSEDVAASLVFLEFDRLDRQVVHKGSAQNSSRPDLERLAAQMEWERVTLTRPGPGGIIGLTGEGDIPEKKLATLLDLGHRNPLCAGFIV